MFTMTSSSPMTPSHADEMFTMTSSYPMTSMFTNSYGSSLRYMLKQKFCRGEIPEPPSEGPLRSTRIRATLPLGVWTPAVSAPQGRSVSTNAVVSPPFAR